MEGAALLGNCRFYRDVSVLTLMPQGSSQNIKKNILLALNSSLSFKMCFMVKRWIS